MNVAFSTTNPESVFQFLESGNKYVNYIFNAVTGVVTKWFEREIHFNMFSFNTDETALYYIDKIEEHH